MSQTNLHFLLFWVGLAIGATVLFLSLSASAQEIEPNFVYLAALGKQRALDIKKLQSSSAGLTHGWADRPLTSLRGDQASQVLIHYRSPLREVERQELFSLTGNEESDSFVAYLPENTYAFYLQSEVAKRVSELPFVIWVGHFREELKISPECMDTSKEPQNNGRVIVNLIKAASQSEAETFEMTKKWVEAWEAKLSSANMNEATADAKTMKIYSQSIHIVALEIHPKLYVEAIKFLSTIEVVHFIHPMHELKLRNREATWVVQTRSTDNHKIWDKGITGQNTLIGVGDSGLDFQNCLLSDSADPPICSDCKWQQMFDANGNVLQTATNCQFTSPVCTSLSGHRKVAAYWAFGDNTDDDVGHGTHVCGTTSGNGGGNAQMAINNGHAPSARIVFTDISDVNMGGLIVPLNLNRNYFPFSYSLGARIHTNSWGAQSNTYSSDTQSIDTFAYNNKDFLILYAAGNSGDQGPGSVDPQGQCKNCLTVGAGRASYQKSLASSYVAASDGYKKAKVNLCSTAWYENAQVQLTQNGNPTSILVALRTFVPTFSAATSTTVKNYYCPKIASPDYCCQMFQQTSLLPNTKNAENVMDVILQNTESACCPAESAPSASANAAGLYDITSVVFFSSRGPTHDGRIKPDLFAPGENIVSARASGGLNMPSCGTANFSADFGLRQLSGTSMATPATAGAAALVRQYYAEGFGLCGHKNTSAAPAKISSSLIKATLINSATLVNSLYVDQSANTNRRLSTTGNDIFIMGNGLIKLSNALRFDGDTTDLFFVDYPTPLATGQSMTYNVFVNSTATPFKATLVWNDPPSTPAAGKNLINDLDLTVVTPSGTTLLGNGQYGINTGRDTLNNVETVIVNTPQIGTYRITVTANAVNTGNTQDFALVATYGLASPLVSVCGPPQADNADSPFAASDAAGVIAGAVVAVVVVGALIAFAVFYAKKRKFRNDTQVLKTPQEVPRTVHQPLQSFPSNFNSQPSAQPGAAQPMARPNGNANRPPPPVSPRPVNAVNTLPPGWQEFNDDRTGVPYYFNQYTNATQWERPR